MATNSWNTVQTAQATIPTQATAAQVQPGLINSVAKSDFTPNSNASAYDASKATATGYDPTNWNVDSKQTVQGQLTGLISSGSPLFDMARSQALESMNGRGVANSSMAIEAGQKAVLGAALPIAQQDASTYANSAQTNAGAANRASEFGAAAENTKSLADQNADNTAKQVNANAQNSLTQQANSIGATQAEQNAQAQNAATAQNAQAVTQANSQTANLQTQTNQFNTDLASKVNQFNASQSNDLTKAGISADAQVKLANIEADYKTLMQSSSSAADVYRQTMDEISKVLTDTNMDQAGKTNAVNAYLSWMKNQLNMTGSINGVDLTGLLNFGTVQ